MYYRNSNFSNFMVTGNGVSFGAGVRFAASLSDALRPAHSGLGPNAGFAGSNGGDQQASEWKYLPVRRLALFLEETRCRGTQWVVLGVPGLLCKECV